MISQIATRLAFGAAALVLLVVLCFSVWTLVWVVTTYITATFIFGASVGLTAAYVIGYSIQDVVDRVGWDVRRW